MVEIELSLNSYIYGMSDSDFASDINNRKSPGRAKQVGYLCIMVEPYHGTHTNKMV